MTNVTVTNGNEEAFTGRFDGKEYEFPPGAAVIVDVRVAAFLFAYGMPDRDRDRALARNGWHTSSDPKHPNGPLAAMKRLQRFAFKKAPDSVRAKPEFAKLPDPKVTSHATINTPGSRAPLAPSSAAA